MRASHGARLGEADAIALIECPAGELPALLAAAGALRDRVKGRDVTYSRKVFLPVTNSAATAAPTARFARIPGDPGAWTMTPDEIAQWSRRGRELGCSEALMCLGDKPEAGFQGISRDARRAGRRAARSSTWRGPARSRSTRACCRTPTPAS